MTITIELPVARGVYIHMKMVDGKTRRSRPITQELLLSRLTMIYAHDAMRDDIPAPAMMISPSIC